MFRYDSFLSREKGVAPTPKPTPVFIGVTTSEGGVGSTFSAAIPSGHQADDILIIVVETSISATVTPPSGWNLLFDEIWDGGNSSRHYVMWRRATSAAEPSATMPKNNHHAHVMICIRGCPTTGSPFGATATTGFSGVSSADITFPSVTTTAASDLLVFAGTSSIDSGTAYTSLTDPAGGSGLTNATLRGVISTGANQGGLAAIATAEKQPAGATGNPTLTTPSSQPVCGTTLVLKAA